MIVFEQSIIKMYSDDLENWMQNLSKKLKQIPIINLAIPGSHDSMTYGVSNKDSGPAPDAEKEIIPIYHVLPCIVRKWARTQEITVFQQLKNGIRFLDLRVAKREYHGNYYFVHGLYCDKVQRPFQELRQFLIDHPCEFVILDCQHFYNFESADHDAFSKILIEFFGKSIYKKRNGSLLNCTLDTALSYGKQVLIIYRENSPLPGIFWSSEDFPTPWPNKVLISELKDFLNQVLKKRIPVRVFGEMFSNVYIPQ